MMYGKQAQAVCTPTNFCVAPHAVENKSDQEITSFERASPMPRGPSLLELLTTPYPWGGQCFCQCLMPAMWLLEPHAGSIAAATYLPTCDSMGDGHK